MTTAALAAPDLHPASWYAARRTGIGGSDIPVLAGLSGYDKTAHDIFLEKMGEAPPERSKPHLEVGQVIEDAIAQLYTRRTGRRLIRLGSPVRDPENGFAIGNIDRKVRGEHRLLEIKNRRYLERGALPADIECQVQWYLGVTRYPVADVAILVSGNDLRIIEVAADPAYYADLIVIAGDFWEHVLRGVPPPIDGSAGAARYLAKRYPWHRDEDLAPATPDIDALVTELREAGGVKAWGEEREGAVKNAIKALLGDSPGVQGAGYRITWRRSADYDQIDYRGVVETLLRDASDYERAELAIAIKASTKTVEGSRRFVPTFEEAPAA